MEINFAGKTALVTGAGKGIGREIVRLLAKCGANVIAMTRTQSDLDSLKEEIPNLRTICADLLNLDDALKAVEEAGTIDYLVNNAAYAFAKSCMEATREEIGKAMLVNVTAPVLLTQIVAKRLIAEEKSGAVVNISSISSVVGNILPVPYGCSKAALNLASKGFAVELAPRKIRVNCVQPGVISTDSVQQLLDKGDVGVDEFVRNMAKRNPVGRIGKTEEIAHTVAFLLSDKASFITGQCIPVDGGYLAN